MIHAPLAPLLPAREMVDGSSPKWSTRRSTLPPARAWPWSCSTGPQAMALVGQTLTQAGGSPAARRSADSVHLSACWVLGSKLMTP